jgi:hypothetical protein
MCVAIAKIPPPSIVCTAHKCGCRPERFSQQQPYVRLISVAVDRKNSSNSNRTNGVCGYRPRRFCHHRFSLPLLEKLGCVSLCTITVFCVSPQLQFGEFNTSNSEISLILHKVQLHLAAHARKQAELLARFLMSKSALADCFVIFRFAAHATKDIVVSTTFCILQILEMLNIMW